MAKWLKILLWSLGGFLVLAAFTGSIFYLIYLRPDFRNEPGLGSSIENRIIRQDTLDRKYQVYIPQQLDRDTPTMLFVIHGSTGSGPEIRKQTAYEFDLIADETGIVVVYPTGYFNHWNDCRGSADYLAKTRGIDDITFLKKIEEDISKKLNLDFMHRFAMGHSNGGHFVLRLALEVPDWISGIAPVSANMPEDQNLDCLKSGRFVPLVLINGMDDPINPYAGGLVTIMGNSSRGAVSSTQETMTFWTKLDSCRHKIRTTKITPTEDDSSVRIDSWMCDGASRTQLITVYGGGHTIPHPEISFPKILGTTNHDINAPREIWKFFDQIR